MYWLGWGKQVRLTRPDYTGWAWFLGVQGSSLRCLYFETIMVGGRHLAERMIDTGTTLGLVSILSIEGLQHSFQGLGRQSERVEGAGIAHLEGRSVEYGT